MENDRIDMEKDRVDVENLDTGVEKFDADVEKDRVDVQIFHIDVYFLSSMSGLRTPQSRLTASRLKIDHIAGGDS